MPSTKQAPKTHAIPRPATIIPAAQTGHSLCTRFIHLKLGKIFSEKKKTDRREQKGNKKQFFLNCFSLNFSAVPKSVYFVLFQVELYFEASRFLPVIKTDLICPFQQTL